MKKSWLDGEATIDIRLAFAVFWLFGVLTGGIASFALLAHG